MDTDTHRWKISPGVPAGRHDGSGGFQPAVEILHVSRHVVSPDPAPAILNAATYQHLVAFPLRGKCYPPLPKGEGRGEGERTSHKQKQTLRLTIPLCLLAFLFFFSGCTSNSKTTATPVISVNYESTHTYTISKRTGKPIKPGYEIQADGKCIIRSIAGDETLLKLSREEVAKMISYCENQGFFSISNESLNKASQPVTSTSLDLQLVTNEVSGLVSMEVTGGSIIFSGSPSMESHAAQVTLSIQAGSLKNSISYYNLDKEIAYNTNATQFQIIGRCLDEIHETIQKSWRRKAHPLTPLR